MEKKRVKCLVFRIRKRYFNDIVAGLKPVEYRRDSPFWRRRFRDRNIVKYIALFLCGKTTHRRDVIKVKKIKTPNDFSEQGKQDVDTPYCWAVSLGDAL